MDFIELVKNALEEQNKTIKDLFADNIVSENTFYKYKQRYPSLKTLIKIANYLQVSIDYLFEFVDKNTFVPYVLDNSIFYENVLALIKNKNISGRQFCKDLNYSRDNLLRWKNGTAPTVRSLLEIAQYFNCFVDDLLM